MSGKRIETPKLSTVKVAIAQAVDRHGHPYDVPMDALEGIDPETANICFSLLASEPFPTQPMAATAKWLRLVEESSHQVRNANGSATEFLSARFGDHPKDQAQC